MPIDLGSKLEKPLYESLISQGWLVCFFTLANSNGHSITALAAPLAIPAKIILYSIPPRIGTYYFRNSDFSEAVKTISKTEKDADLKPILPKKIGTEPL